MDVLSPVGGTSAIVVDWKSGMIDEGYTNQLAGYAYLTWNALERHPEAEITTVTVFLRYGYYRTVKWKAADIQAWEADLLRNVAVASPPYKPGVHCEHCPHYASCEARREIVRGVMSSLVMTETEAKQAGIRKITDEIATLLSGLTVATKDEPLVGQTLADLMFRVRLTQKALDDAKQLIRGTVAQVGAINLHDGTELRFHSMEVNEVNPPKAMKVLARHMSNADIHNAMKLSLPKLLDTVTLGQVPKMKPVVRDELMQALKGVGALTTKTINRLEQVERNKPLKGKQKHGEPKPAAGTEAAGAPAEGTD
jgi:hypothetical protein